MTARPGRAIGTCACGCGGQLSERVYELRRGGAVWESRRIPRYLPGHAARLRSNWAARVVPAAEVAARILDYKRQRGLTWSQVAEVLGVGSRSEAHAITTRAYVTRRRAEHILLALAGLPRPPTRHEQRATSRPCLGGRERNERRTCP